MPHVGEATGLGQELCWSPARLQLSWEEEGSIANVAHMESPAHAE